MKNLEELCYEAANVLPQHFQRSYDDKFLKILEDYLDVIVDPSFPGPVFP